MLQFVVFAVLTNSLLPRGWCQVVVSLQPCMNGVFDILDNAPSTLICSAPWWTTGMSWLAHGSQGSTGLAHCVQAAVFPLACPVSTSGVDLEGVVLHINASFSGHFSELVVTPSGNTTWPTTVTGIVTSLQTFQTISCSTSSPIQSTVLCSTDLIHLPEKAACSETLTAHTNQPWSLIVNCDVTKTYSLKGRYSCQTFSTGNKLAAAEPAPLGSAVAMTTRAIDGVYHVSGSCTMTSQFPALDGNYTFFVEIIPGRKRYDLVFDGRSEVYKPSSAILEHNCPGHVVEGDDVTCTCSSRNNDLGSPKGRVQWNVSASDRLAVSNVQRTSLDIRRVQCQLVWNGAIVKSLSATIDIWWKPTRPSHNCPANVDEGTDVTCSCVISNDGNPKATVMWLTGSSSLALVNISRADNGKVFTCQVVWDGNPLYTLQYPLPVRYKPTSPRLSHNCPSYVTEGSSLDCTCVTSDPGSPPAVLNWSTTPSEHLVLPNVQRNDEGLTMTCLMTWGGAVVTSVNYTLLVIPDAQAAFSRGLGVGLGVGVALLVTAVVVVVVLLWRRGWTLALPCRHWTPDRTQLRDVMKFTQADTELSLPDDHRSGDPAQVYDKMDVTHIGFPSTYQSLTVTPAKPKNTKRAKQNKKKAVSSRGHDNPTMAGEGDLMTQKRTGGAGGETYQNVTKSQREPPKKNKSYTADSEIYGNA